MKYLLSCILITLTSLSLTAQPVSATDFGKDADQVILLDSTSVNVASTGSGTFSIYKSILVNNNDGALANRKIIYDYDPLTAFAEFEYATIHKSNGEDISLDVAKTCDYAAPARMIYWGARQIMLEVGKLDKGDILEYKINKKGFTYALLSDNEAEAYNPGAFTATAGCSAVEANSSTANCSATCSSAADCSAAPASEEEDRFIPPMRGQFYDIVPFWCQYPTVRKVYWYYFLKKKNCIINSIRENANPALWKKATTMSTLLL